MNYFIFVCKYPYDTSFFFTYGITWSSNFDSMQQLIDVGLDDPDKVVNPRLHNYSIKEFVNELTSDGITKVNFIGSVKNLKDIEELYPEHML